MYDQNRRSGKTPSLSFIFLEIVADLENKQEIDYSKNDMLWQG
jgi:hypothetical protein